jgi:hypothetical protein
VGAAQVSVLGGGALALALAATVVLTIIGVRRARQGAGTAVLAGEQDAYAEMDRLCPHGWEAQITVHGARMRGAAPPGAPAHPIELVWRELTDRPLGPETVAVTRRLWASDINAALAAMVQSRRTDALLEEVEARGPRPEAAE